MWKFEVYEDQNVWRWRLVLRSALIVESSECFDGRADAQRAAEVARADLSEAPIDVLLPPPAKELTQHPEHAAALHAELRADTARWNALPLVGFQYGEEECDRIIVELRHCTCGSTLGRRVRNDE